MRNLFPVLAAVCGLSLSAAAQNVGINNNNPTTTLHVVGKPTTTTIADGITIPALTGDQLKAKDAMYTVAQGGTLLYITAAVGTSSVKTANVTASGFYFFDGSLWQKAATAAIADSTNDAFANDAANTMVKLATKSDGITARAANTDFVVKDDGKVGIGTTTPTVPLDIMGKMAATDELFIRRNIEGGQLLLQGQTATDANWTIDQINNNTNPRFRIFNGAAEVNGISIKENGNVGVGVADATEKLTVATGNITATTGWVRGFATGQLLNSVFYDDPRSGTVATPNTTSSWVDVISYTYTPISANSKIMVQYHNNSYLISGNSSAAKDEFQTQILVGAISPTTNTQTLSTDLGNVSISQFRTGTIFPITGVANNSTTNSITIKVQVQRSSGDDIVTINQNNGTLIIQEIAN